MNWRATDGVGLPVVTLPLNLTQTLVLRADNGPFPFSVPIDGRLVLYVVEEHGDRAAAIAQVVVDGLDADQVTISRYER